MADTSIEWTDATWNPVAGCSIISPGCKNCYAMRMAARLEAMGTKKYSGLTRKSGDRYVWTGKIFCDDTALLIPKQWKKPKKIFVNSMSDLFHHDVSHDFVRKVWDVMRETPQHTYQILTKRPDRMRDFIVKYDRDTLTNVWLGTSVEDKRTIDRLDALRQIPAIIRFVSFEPLIGSVGDANLSNIHWAIVGGESGPKSRPIRVEWVDEIVNACRAHGTTFFFKQWGGKNKKKTGRTYRDQTWDGLPELRM